MIIAFVNNEITNNALYDLESTSLDSILVELSMKEDIPFDELDEKVKNAQELDKNNFNFFVNDKIVLVRQEEDKSYLLV